MVDEKMDPFPDGNDKKAAPGGDDDKDDGTCVHTSFAQYYLIITYAKINWSVFG
jgi:hypothetical protein